VAAEEGINHVRDAIEMLPEKYREVLSLIYVKNMSAVAVAEQLNLKESAVYMRVARGKEMLRDQLGSQSNFFS
jgi:RNA polymerase sigma factor (sigma-70 family)